MTYANNEEDAIDLEDPIIDEDPKAETSGLGYDNREGDQYIYAMLGMRQGLIPVITPVIKRNILSPYLLHITNY